MVNSPLRTWRFESGNKKSKNFIRGLERKISIVSQVTRSTIYSKMFFDSIRSIRVKMEDYGEKKAKGIERLCNASVNRASKSSCIVNRAD